MTRAEAERLLPPAAIAAARRNVDAAPPIRPEQREQLRAVFASVRAMQELKLAAVAA
jgi:hypothetical protein